MTERERRGLITGLAVSAGLVALDVLTRGAAISGAYMLGAIVAAVLGGRRPAAVAAVITFALAVVSGVWNDDWGTTGYIVRLFVAFLGNFFALEAGRLNDGSFTQLRRQQLLAAVADLPAPGASPSETAERVAALLVPDHTGYAAIDAELAGTMVRLAGRGTEPIDQASRIATPLRARGREIGSLVVGGGMPARDEPEFMRVLGGRVALALDNAGLSAELLTVEQQLQAVLANLAEAVTVQDRSGAMVFANRAAADLLGADSVADLLQTSPETLRARFRLAREDGSGVDIEQFPNRQLLAGDAATPLVVRATNAATGEERWRINKSTPVAGPDGETVLIVNVIEDITDMKRNEIGQRLLAEASAALASSLEWADTLQLVADLAVPALADWCVVSVPRGDMLEAVAVAHGDPQMAALTREYAQRWPQPLDADAGSSHVMRTGAPILVSDFTEAMLDAAAVSGDQRAALDRLGVHSVLQVPMATAERGLGVFSFINSESQRRFGDDDLELGMELARRAATALENARLYTELERVANTLQRSLLPPDLPDVPGWRFDSLYMPAGGQAEVGGDFYDVFPTAAGWMAVMGDVVGRGPAAASLTTMARYTLRTAGSLVGTPTMGLARLNENLRERGEMALCTVAVVLLRDGEDEASLVSAGHPLPLLIRGGEPQTVGRTGPLLGAFDHGHWLSAPVMVEPGDVLVLYTDGVTDSRGHDDRFGEDRLRDALTGTTSAEDAVARVRSALQQFSGTEQDDDTAVLAIQRV